MIREVGASRYCFSSTTSPWTDDRVRDLYRAESPLIFAANVKSPTSIMTDAGDQRVPTPLAYAFFPRDPRDRRAAHDGRRTRRRPLPERPGPQRRRNPPPGYLVRREAVDRTVIADGFDAETPADLQVVALLNVFSVQRYYRLCWVRWVRQPCPTSLPTGNFPQATVRCHPQHHRCSG